MLKNKFWLSSLVLMFLFAVFIAGGCGGGSSHHSTNRGSQESENGSETQTESETQTGIPNISDITESEEFKRVMKDLENEFISDDITTGPNIHYILILSGDKAIIDDEDFTTSSKKSQMVKTSATLPQEELERIASKLKQPYESGDVIALAWPSAATINDLYTALGEQSTYVDPYEELSNDLAPEDTYPEFYAIAKRYNGNSAHYFTYLLPGSKTILANAIFGNDFSSEDVSENESGDVSGDVSEDVLEDVLENYSGEDDGSISDEYKGLRAAYVFQARRYAAFIRWVAHIDDDMEEQKAYVQSSSLIRSAADQSTSLYDYAMQKETVNLDCYKEKYKWLYYGQKPFSFSAQASEIIFSYHDVLEKKDYYVVRSDSYLKPDFAKRTDGGWIYTAGSPKWYRYIHLLENVGSYSLIKNMPHNVNRSSTLTQNMSHSTPNTVIAEVGTKIGTTIIDSSAELNASIVQGMSYGSSKTWKTTEWSLTNECDNQVAKWLVSFFVPGGQGYYPYWNGDVPEASKNRTDYHSEWIWQVSDPTPDIQMNVQLAHSLRSTKGNGKYRYYSSDWVSYPVRRVKLHQPPRVFITSGGGSHTFGKDGANNIIFKFICLGNWTITSSQPDWCYVTDEQVQGGDTNLREIPIHIFVEPFNTEGNTKVQTRNAVITVTNTDTGQIQTVRVTQSNR